MDEEIWKKSNQFCAFLQLWASEPRDERAPISECYSQHIRSRSYAKPTLPLLNGFIHDYEYYQSFKRQSQSLQAHHSTFSAHGRSGEFSPSSLEGRHTSFSAGGSRSVGNGYGLGGRVSRESLQRTLLDSCHRLLEVSNAAILVG